MVLTYVFLNGRSTKSFSQPNNNIVSVVHCKIRS